MFATFGVLGGQTTLAAILLGVGPYKFLQRAPLIVLAWALSLTLLTAIRGLIEIELFLAIDLVLLAHIIALQVPLFMMRRFLNWRIGEPHFPIGLLRPNQFSLRTLFFWIGGCACLLGALRFALTVTGRPAQFWGFLGVIQLVQIAVIPMSVGCVFSLLAAWLTTPRRFFTVRLIVVAIALVAIAYFVAFLPASFVGGYRILGFEFLVLLIGSHAAWLLANLFLLRMAGYRFESAVPPKPD